MTAEQLALLTPAEKAGTATFSQCGRYRYTLGRRIAPTHLGDTPHLLFVMLNPSTADDTVPDPTITRCLGFTESHGYGAMRVVNLLAPNRLWCLALTKEGQPGHPLYLPAKRILDVWVHR